MVCAASFDFALHMRNDSPTMFPFFLPLLVSCVSPFTHDTSLSFLLLFVRVRVMFLHLLRVVSILSN